MLAYLLNAVTAELAAEFGDDLGDAARHCRVTLPPGKPPPFAGQWFVAVWSPADFGDGNGNYYGGTFSIKVTITFRMAWAPQDRQGSESAKTGGALGFYRWADRAKHRLHGSDAVRNAANTAYAADQDFYNGMVENLIFRGTTYQTRGPDWVGSESEDPAAAEEVVTAELSFDNALQVTKLRADA